MVALSIEANRILAVKNRKRLIPVLAVIITAVSVVSFFSMNETTDNSVETVKKDDKEAPRSLIKVKPTPPPEFLKN